ncbi:MAG: hypothetical protein M4D80_08585 [Myxococcota bacterium]|nr:hypothetical protein [Deltaproteobacteria bacterium]MDQ3335205.1 hypothetical protein [Myxococcota bacterium]
MLEREIDELRRREPSTPRRARPPSTPPTPKPIPANPIDELDNPIDELAQRGPEISPVFVALALCFGLATMFLAYFVVRSS